MDSSSRESGHDRPAIPVMSFSSEQGNLCAGCLPSGRCRFGLRLRAVEDGVVVGSAYFDAAHEGAGGVVHGGSTMGALDEACGCVVITHGAFAVTAELETTFRRPVPIERELEVRAWAESRDERGHWIIRAEILLPGGPRALCSVRGRFVEADPDRHFGRFRDWLGTAAT